VLAIAGERGELAQPVVADGPVDLLAEVVHAARHEQARGVGDALLRRTRLGLTAARAVTDAQTAERVARAMAPELGWDDARVSDELEAWRDEASAEGIVRT
jgi:glycerol-3-phosphate dehydrogenase